MRLKAVNPLTDLFVRVTKLAVIGVYSVFFGWWLDGIQARSVEQKLKNRVRRNLGFLFNREGAVFVPNDDIYPGGGKVVTLAANGIVLRIAHDRKQDFVDIAPQHADGEWEPISLALLALDAKDAIAELKNVRSRAAFLSLSELAPLLDSRFEELKKAYSPGDYPSTKQALERLRRSPKHARTRVLVRTSNTAQG